MVSNWLLARLLSEFPMMSRKTLERNSTSAEVLVIRTENIYLYRSEMARSQDFTRINPLGKKIKKKNRLF